MNKLFLLKRKYFYYMKLRLFCEKFVKNSKNFQVWGTYLFFFHLYSYYLIPCEFFLRTFAGGRSFESEWLQIFLGLKESS